MPPLAAAIGLSVPELIGLGGAVGGLASTGLTVGNALSNHGAGPDPMTAAKEAQQASDQGRLRGTIGQSVQDGLTKTSGGASPEFLANLATQNAGTPDSQSDALDMVKQLLKGGG